MKTVTAREAYAKYTELKNKPVRVTIVNECPDCMGTGVDNGKVCPTCGGEPDNTSGLYKKGLYWYKKA